MPVRVIEGDITKLRVDAIVNAANNTLLGDGGVDGAIHDAAGSDLFEECASLGGCETGDAKITGAYNLAATYIIHAVGPIWRGGTHNEEALLRRCYAQSLKLAEDHDCKSIAFPAISTGAFAFPLDRAAKIAVDAVFQSKLDVILIAFDSETRLCLSKALRERGFK